MKIDEVARALNRLARKNRRRIMERLADRKLLPGYAMTSTRRRPKEPELVVVGSQECALAHCVGAVLIDGRSDWLAFKVRGQRRYYFQQRPW
jgi:hypothetical protein